MDDVTKYIIFSSTSFNFLLSSPGNNLASQTCIVKGKNSFAPYMGLADSERGKVHSWKKQNNTWEVYPCIS